MGPHPAVAAIRLAVRRVLHDIITEHTQQALRVRPGVASPDIERPDIERPDAGQADSARPDLAVSGAESSRPPIDDGRPLVLVACSGGADSMALASALAFEARKLSVRAGAVTVDHGSSPAPTSAPPKSSPGSPPCGSTPSSPSP